MTQDSYTNYVANMMVFKGRLASKLVSSLAIAKCDYKKLTTDLLLADAYIDILKCWDLFDDTTASTTVTETGVQNKDLFLEQVIELSSAAVNSLNLEVGNLLDITNLVSGEVVSDSLVVDIDLQPGNTYFVYMSTFTTYNGAGVSVSKDLTTEDSNPNCLDVSDMKAIASNLNKIFGSKYCVDFIL